MNRPLTPCEHCHSAAVEEAARWLVEQPLPPRPLVPTLRQRFDLTVPEACEASALAQLFRTRRQAFA